MVFIRKGVNNIDNFDLPNCDFLINNPAKREHFLNLEKRLQEKIIGQDAAISTVCRAVKRNAVGLKDPKKPVGSFIFLGTSGCGKTQLCRALAQVLYGSENFLIKLDMSEFSLDADSKKLTGAPNGYIGYENGSMLVNTVKMKPYSVLCLDEIEKAHPDIFNVFLQIMEDGVLTSALGETVSFKDVLIIFTSNLGSFEISQTSKSIGFSRDCEKENNINIDVKIALKKTFKTEFLNRIDEVITFNQLSENDILKICKIELDKVIERAKNLNIEVDFDESAIQEIAKLGFDKEYGARPLKRVISAKIEDLLADKVLLGELNYGDKIRISYNNGGFIVVKKYLTAATKGVKND